jgi:uncharacterized protein (DUF488 family)
MTHHLFTVGHSNHPFDYFADLLKTHGVSAIADVRSAPYSRFAPQFSQDPLRRSLGEAGIRYVFLGRELGARSTDPSCYEHGRVRYDRLARTDLFQDGLDRLIQGSEREIVAIMCTEKDPLDCHRTLLVAREAIGRDCAVDHILADGSLESHQDSLLRLLDKMGQRQADLFTATEERIDRALSEQEARIAYVDRTLAQASDGPSA